MNALWLSTPALRALLPEGVVAAAALAALALDVSVMHRRTLRVRTATAALLGVMGCIFSLLLLLHAPAQASVAGGMFVASPLTALVQMGVLVLAICVLLILPDAPGTRHAGETVLLILLATVGMLLLIAAQDLLLIFLALELLSLPLYILTALDARTGTHGAHAAEAGLKYFLFGGASSAMLLFGFSLLYGVANSTRLVAIAASVQSAPSHPLLLVATALIVAGLGFKIAAAPFHFWAPDVYEAAPAPAAALIASGSKVAAFFLFLLAAINVGTLYNLAQQMRRLHARNGAASTGQEMPGFEAPSGLLARIFSPMLRLTQKSWHMYGVGFLFGLGFDTASEVALLALSATQIAHGIGFAQVMMLPALFTAGMMLLDTADSIFMAGAYGWAMLHPARKLGYNFTITAASVLMAAFIGSVEIADLLGERLHMSSGLWGGIATLNNNLTLFGICALGVFAFCWIAASVLFRRYRSPAI